MSVLDILIKSLRSYIFILLAAKVFDDYIYAKPHGIMPSIFIIGIFPRHAIRQIEEFGIEYLMWDVCLGSYHY